LGVLAAADGFVAAGFAATGAVCGVVALAGAVLVVAVMPGFAAAALDAVPGDAGLSNSFIFCSNAARAAAWTGESSARTERKPAPIAMAQRGVNNFMICILFFYANSPWDATAFPPGESNFCQACGRG